LSYRRMLKTRANIFAEG